MKKIFILYYFIYFLGSGAWTIFNVLYFKDTLNFTGSEYGLINSLGIFVSIFFVPFWGIVSDHYKKHKLVLKILIVATSLLLLIYRKIHMFIPVLVMGVFIDIFKFPIKPLANNIALSYSLKNNYNFARIRLFGSLGFISAAVLIEQLLRIGFSMDVIFIVSSIMFLSCFGLIFFFPNINVEKKEISLKKNLPLLMKNKKFILISIIFFLFIGTIGSSLTYTSLYIKSFESSYSYGIGIGIFLSVFPEILAMSVLDKVISKYGTIKVIYFAILLSIGRWIAYYFAGDVSIFYALAPLHGIVNGLVLVSGSIYVKNNTPEEISATSLTLFNSLGFFGGRAFINLLAGGIIEKFGVRNIFIFYLVNTVAALFFIIKLSRIENNKKIEVTL